MTTSNISLEDKIVVVTGASRGIGEAIARASAEAGATVVLASRKLAALEEIATSITDGGGKALAVACHTGKPEQVDALFATAVAKLGRVDALVNNAAANPYFGPLIEIPESAFDKTIEVNVKGYFYCARAYVHHLRSRNAETGSILNVASVAGLRAAPAQGVYAMTKAAVISFTKTLAAELGSSNIRVNALAPGLVDTRFAAAIVKNDSLRDLVVSRTPLGRVGEPREIAGAAVYLTSAAASFVTGHVMVIDGGWVDGA